MSHPLNPLMPLAQMGHVEKIAEALQNQPVASQALAQNIANESIQHAKEKVEAGTGSTKGKQVSRDGEKQASQGGGGGGTGGEKKDAENQEPSENAANPWAGNLLNLKV